MDAFTLRYGPSGRTLDLSKSVDYVGVRPSPGAARQLIAALPAASGGLAEDAGRSLGGFRLARVVQGNAGVGAGAGSRRLARAEDSLDTLRENAAVAVGTHVFETAADGVPFVPTGQLFIRWRAGVRPARRHALLLDHGLELVQARGEHDLVVRITPRSGNPLKVAHALQHADYESLVAVAEPDLAAPGWTMGFVQPNDARAVDQWHLRNTGFHRGTTFGFVAGADARVRDAWDRAGSLGSRDAIVAVIDDGFDLKHPDLSGDGKQVAPFDFTRGNAEPVPDPTLFDRHGTACAGVAVGAANGDGILGAAPDCRLMPVRWGPNLSDDQVERWFDHVCQHGAWVVSCSWSNAGVNAPLSTRMHEAIARCARKGRGGLGTVVCFAAGNENADIDAPAKGTVNGFATHPDVIAVAACTSMDQRAHDSNFGDAISVCAPSSGAGGWGITTSDVMGKVMRGGLPAEAGFSPGPFTDVFGGTSSATPLVAGICALLLSVNPKLTAAEVKRCLQRTARRIGDPASYDPTTGHSREFGFGCVNADAAVADVLAGAAAPPPPPPPPPPSRQRPPAALG